MLFASSSADSIRLQSIPFYCYCQICFSFSNHFNWRSYSVSHLMILARSALVISYQQFRSYRNQVKPDQIRRWAQLPGMACSVPHHSALPIQVFRRSSIAKVEYRCVKDCCYWAWVEFSSIHWPNWSKIHCVKHEKVEIVSIETDWRYRMRSTWRISKFVCHCSQTVSVPCSLLLWAVDDFICEQYN